MNIKFRRTVFFLLSVLCFLVLAGTALWWSLKKGIEIDRLSFASTRISQLYLRLDHGLIIHAGQINIAGDGTGGGEASLESWIPQIKKWVYLIQEIEVNRLTYRNHSVAVTYREGKFDIRGNEFSLEAQATYDLGAFYINLSRLEIKPYTIIFSGKASYVRNDDRFLFDGFFESSWGKGEVRLEEKKGMVEARIRTGEFTGLEALLKQFPLDEEVIAWVSKNISARYYQINQLLVRFSLQELNDTGPENISGTATAESATIQFHPDLPPVHCERIRINFRDDRLTFDLEKPRYEGKNLDGSEVYIDNIIRPHSVLAIHIRTKSRLDNTVSTLLEKYDIRLPFCQLSGQTQADVNLLFDLPEFQLKTTGIFSADTGAWQWADIPLQADDVSVHLTDNRITINNAEVSYSDIFRARLEGVVDTSARQAGLASEIEHLELSAGGRTMLQAAQVQLPLEIDFGGESIRIGMEQIGTVIALNEEGTTIDIENLATVRPFVPFLQHVAFSEGNVHVSFSDLSRLDFSGRLEIPDSILSLENKPVTLFTFQGTGTPEKTSLSINEGRILVNITDKAEIILNEYLPTVDANSLKNEKNVPSFPVPLVITGPHVMLHVKDFEIPTRNFEYRLTGGNIVFAAALDKGRLLFESSGDKINLIGNGLDANLAEKFIRFTDLSEGLVNINLEGDAEGYYGYLEFSNVVIREYLLMNNILAFLNSIPALATFSEPGFDQDGYRVRDGIVLFDLQDKLLTIRQLRTDGITVNCEATGWLDFGSRTLKLNMELITFKDYSKIIDMLPWAGYAILGDDGSLSTTLKIDGSLDDPVITTYLAKDIIMTPVNIFWRTVEWPFRFFYDKKEEEPEPPEWLIPTPMVP